MMTFLYSMLVMNGLVISILIILILIKRYVAVYDDYTITISDEKSITVHGGDTLASSLQKNDIFIPSACGGKGTCGFCKIKITDGISAPISIEEAVLPYKNLISGYRLSCQTKVRNDMTIDLPEDYLNVKEYTGEITKIEILTHDIKRFQIKLITPDEITFKSGQFVVVTPIPGETRAYSIASIKQLKDMIFIEVKKIPNGLCSTYLHALKVHEKITFFGPYGDFFLKDTDHKVICVAGGVGLAPMKPIIGEIISSYEEREVELYYGARTIDDMYDYDKYVNLTKNPKFKFYPALSEINEILHHPSGVVFDTGFINYQVEKRLTHGEDCEAYLCGPPIMVDAVIKTLKAKGVPEERIYFDKF
jgi:Na+-transporting NADH:ubiquinone oxidoreductase subunit F